MKTADHISSTTTNLQHKKQENTPFFSKEDTEHTPFFSKSNADTFFSPATIQPKLTIGQPNDKYEQEADATADKVVQKLADTESVQHHNVANTIQQKCAECQKEETIQKKPIFESAQDPASDEMLQPKCATCEAEEKVQKKEDVSSSSNPANLESRLSASKGSGSPLSSETQSSMESAFGTDFSSVRVHTGTDAVQMNKDIGAQAFTHGSDIYFNQGKYNTNSREGNKLLAHELTHTVQQGASLRRTPDIQKEEEVDKEELRKQIEQSNREQRAAYDPSEANKTKQEAAKEGQQAEQFASQQIPEVIPPKPEPLPVDAESGGRTATPIPKKPDIVVPSSKKPQGPAPQSDSVEPAAQTGGGEGSPGATGGGANPASGAGSGDSSDNTSTGSTPATTGGSGNAGSNAGGEPSTGGGETLEYLEKESANVCNDGAKKSQELADNESAHDTAQEKADQTDIAVVPPEEEGQSRSNADQVSTLDEAQPPEANDDEVKREMDQAISDAVPSKVKELNEFESEKKAQVIGNKVLAGTAKQVGEVQGTYNEIEQAPPPAESPVPEPLPQIEQAPDTATLNLGQGAVPSVPEEQTDLSQYEKEADNIYEKEGISPDMQAEFENVDSGDIAEANKEKSVLKEKVANEPAKLQTFATEQQSKVEGDLRQEEEKAKASMEGKRKNELEGAKGKQEKTKTEMEKKREAVTNWINNRYTQAKELVTEKLSKLEEQALAKFDAGQKQYSKQFEQNVKRRVNAWKSDRYSGFWGAAKWIKDKFVGIDHFPEIKRIFTTERQTFVQAIDQLIITINQENEKTIQSCKDELANAKKDIQEYVDNLGPELKATGEKAQQETAKKLAELDQHIEKEKKKLQQKLCDKKDEAIKAIDKKIEEMKSEMSGLVGKLGALLLYAAKKFFKWAISKIGGSADKIIGLLDKGVTVLKKLFTDPVSFFKNLVRAVGGGIKGFVTNIVSWLKKGLAGWLLGQMGDSGLELPQKFNPKGVLFLGLQVAGLTWNVIRPRIVKALGKNGEKMMSAAEKGIDIVKRVIKEGPIALWHIIVEKAAEIKGKVMEAIRNWAITKIIKKMSVKLLSMLNPAGAIFQAIMLLYDVVMFFVENWDRIISFVNSVFDSIGAIASGAIGKASQFIEQTLGKTIPMILSFAARFVGLDGIGKAIRKVIEAIQKPFKKILDKVIKFVVKQVKKLAKKLMAKLGIGKNSDGSTKEGEEGDGELGKTVHFSDGEESHRLWVDESSGQGILKVASNPVQVAVKIKEWKSKVNTSDFTEEKKNEVKGWLSTAENKNDELLQNIKNANKKEDQNGEIPEVLDNQIEQKEESLAEVLKKLFQAFNEDNSLTVPVKASDKIKATYKSGMFHAVVKEVDEEGDKPEDNRVKFQFNWEKLKQRERTHNFVEFNQKWDNDIVLPPPGSTHHGDYKPQNLNPYIEGDFFVLEYDYGPENLGRDELIQMKVKMKVDEVENSNKVTHQVTGYNIAIKDAGSRGKADSARKLEREDLDKTNLPQLNAAHILADWFNGSGYRQGLNLILTSKTYNQETMAGAEGQVHKAIDKIQKKNPNSLVTFDLQVTAVYETTDDDKVVSILQNKQANMSKEALEKMRLELAGEQDPRRCESVRYRVLAIKVDGTQIKHSIKIPPIGPDVGLNQYFSK